MHNGFHASNRDRKPVRYALSENGSSRRLIPPQNSWVDYN